jgi:spore germination cell wall hydrolase CwlJ-like protein
MRRSRLGWASWAIAPWASALVVLVSITARAGEDSAAIDDRPTSSIALSRAIQPVFQAGPHVSLGGLSDGETSDARTAANSADPDGEVHDEPVAFQDGATPMLDDNIASATRTPGTDDDKIIVFAPWANPRAPGAGGLLSDQPDYALLIPAKDSARQMRCLAEAIYFESRSEPLEGQAAVGQVVLNRVRSGLYPSDVCSVVYQDSERSFACQFSFACEGKSLTIQEPGPWAIAMRIAKEVVSGERYDPKLMAALNYHANYVYPAWAPMLSRLERIGNHIFYAMRPGVIWAPGAVVAKADATVAPSAK